MTKARDDENQELLQLDRHTQTHDRPPASAELEGARRELALKSAILESSDHPIFLLNRDCSIFDVNPAATTTFGLSANAMVGRDFSERIIAPICQESFKISFERLVSTESGPLANRKIELSASFSDRREIPIELTLKTIRIGELTQYVAFVRDISEARKTESLLRESESRFRRIFDSNMAPVFFWDLQGSIMDANEAFLKLHGFTRKELAEGKISWKSLMPPGSAGLEKKTMEELQKFGVCAPFEMDVLRSDGSRASVLVTAALLENARDRGICISIDFSRTQANTRSMKEANALMKELLDQAPLFTCVKDREGKFQYVNSTMARNLGFAPEEMLGKTSEDLGLPEAQQNMLADKHIAMTGVPKTLEFEVAHSDGIQRSMRVHKSPWRRPDGRIHGVLAIGQDTSQLEATRKHAQKTVDQLELISNGVAEGILIQDAGGATTFENPMAARLFSQGLTWFTFEGAPLTPGQRPDELVLQGEKESEALFRVRGSQSNRLLKKKAGLSGFDDDRWILQKSIPLRDSSGNLNGVLSIFRDLTEIRNLEELNQQQSAALGIMEALAIHDSEGRFIYVNDAHVALYGYRREELHGKTWHILYDEPELDRISKDVITKFRVAGSWRGETRARRKDGTFFDQEISLCEATNGALVCVIRDISEKKRAELAKKVFSEISRILETGLESESNMRLVAQTVADHLADYCLVDLIESDGRFKRIAATSRNPAEADVLAREIGRSKPLEEAGLLLQTLRTSRTTYFRELSGSENLFESIRPEAQSLLSAPIVARGHLLGAISLVRCSTPLLDLQDTALAEEIARRIALDIENNTLFDRTQKAIASRDDFIAMVSHDLKNPLSAILLNASFMVRTIDRTAAPTERELHIRVQLKNLERSAQRMHKLLCDFLDLARSESGRLILDRHEFRISTLIQETLEDIAAMAAAKNQSLEMRIQLSQDTGYFDRERIEQVLVALLTNAIRFTPESGMIRITARQTPSQLLLSVEDNGPGIPKEDRAELFNRYRNFTTHHRRASHGVGLPLSKGIIEAHGGKLWLEDRPGGGTIFHFTLPQQAPQAN